MSKIKSLEVDTLHFKPGSTNGFSTDSGDGSDAPVSVTIPVVDDPDFVSRPVQVSVSAIGRITFNQTGQKGTFYATLTRSRGSVSFYAPPGKYLEGGISGTGTHTVIFEAHILDPGGLENDVYTFAAYYDDQTDTSTTQAPVWSWPEKEIVAIHALK